MHKPFNHHTSPARLSHINFGESHIVVAKCLASTYSSRHFESFAFMAEVSVLDHQPHTVTRQRHTENGKICIIAARQLSHFSLQRSACTSASSAISTTNTTTTTTKHQQFLSCTQTPFPSCIELNRQ